MKKVIFAEDESVVKAGDVHQYEPIFIRQPKSGKIVGWIQENAYSRNDTYVPVVMGERMTDATFTDIDYAVKAVYEHGFDAVIEISA